MAKQQAKISATNMVERVSKVRKAAAMVTGAAGAALAATMVAAIESLGKSMEAQQVSRKDRLSEIMALDPASRVVFHKAMMDRADKVNADMLEAKTKDESIKGLREFFELHPGQGYIYAETSMWKGMALALDANWKPDLTLPWAALKTAATQHRNGIGKPSTDPANPQNVPAGKRAPGRAATTPQQKAVTAARSALKGADNKPLAKNNRNLAEVVRGILSDATVEELREVAAVVETMLIGATKAAEEAAKVTAKAAQSSTQGKEKLADNQEKTHTGAVVTRTAAVPSNKGGKAGNETGPSDADKLIEQGKEITRAAAKNKRRVSA